MRKRTIQPFRPPRSKSKRGHAKPAPPAGPNESGPWLIALYQPASLFSLKFSGATSSVGRSLLVPTPYAIKMSLIDAAFRAGLPSGECADFLHQLASVQVRISPPKAAVVTHTFVKVRQESRDRDPSRPYISTIAYRELVYHSGLWRWAFDLGGQDEALLNHLKVTAPLVRYIGKRGSFVQFLRIERRAELGPDYTQALDGADDTILPARAHIAVLDDFGPEANLQTLSSYTGDTPKRDKHRRFVRTVVPLGLVNSGPGFSEYESAP